MNFRTPSLKSLASVATSASIIASSLVVTAAPAFVSAAAGDCVNEQGSTTVYPALTHAQSAFQGAVQNPVPAWPTGLQLGCTVEIVGNGSGTGLTALLAYFGIGTPSSTIVNVAASSRPLNSGNEQNNLYGFKVGGDAMVIAVNKNLGLDNIKESEVKGIYEGTITNWNQIAGSSISGTIVPRSRITGSGSRDDLGRLFGVNLTTLEPAVISGTGLPRLTSSADESDAACNNANQVVYTSLANLLSDGPSGSNCLKALNLADGSTTSYVSPSTTSVTNGTYPAPRELFVALPKVANLQAKFGASAWTDNLGAVKAIDLVNYMKSTQGQSHVAAVGFVSVPVAAKAALPDQDVNLDGGIGLGDIGIITGRWSQTNAVKGWNRADVDNNGAVGLTDIGRITNSWGAQGFVAP